VNLRPRRACSSFEDEDAGASPIMNPSRSGHTAGKPARFRVPLGERAMRIGMVNLEIAASLPPATITSASLLM
jgi:hypothetical protein